MLAIQHFTNPDDAVLIWKSPLYSYSEKEGDRLLIHFKDVGDGLCTKDGQKPRGFKLANENGIYQEAEAEIISSDVVAVQLPGD